MNDIVTFGKYRGRPIGQLISDAKYVDWLIAQAWFAEQYSGLAKLLQAGRLDEPQDTPEHNAMIARLIERPDGFAYLQYSAATKLDMYSLKAIMTENIEVEPKGGDIATHGVEMIIEAKPILGDDYPTVIRKLKTGTTKYVRGREKPVRTPGVVIVGETSFSLTFEQVAKQFTMAGLRLITEAEFEAGADKWPSIAAPLLRNCIAELEADIIKNPTRRSWRDRDLEEAQELLKSFEP